MFLRLSVPFASLLLCLAASSVVAESMPAPAPPIVGAKSYLMIDSQTGHELASLKADAALAPASLTKLMTTYVVFRALKQEQIRLEDEVTISEKAWRTEGSRMFVEVGTRVSIQDLLIGIIVQSGNDASVALSTLQHWACTPVTFSTRRACRPTVTRQPPEISRR
jgi:D-alanyl-D-alanine carboxypeptidase (penicillin-binding protein 5/6)